MRDGYTGYTLQLAIDTTPMLAVASIIIARAFIMPRTSICPPPTALFEYACRCRDESPARRKPPALFAAERSMVCLSVFPRQAEVVIRRRHHACLAGFT